MRNEMKPKFKIHSGQMEVEVSALLNYRVYAIVPNVSWGWLRRHEADMIAVDDKLRATEIEIKISLQDLKKDFDKGHGHHDKKVGRLVYAVPEFLLENAIELVPKHCGIISVSQLIRKDVVVGFMARWYRQCRFSKDYEPITKDSYIKLLELGCMRIWSLKNHNNN
jgi:hypothetical protein